MPKSVVNYFVKSLQAKKCDTVWNVQTYLEKFKDPFYAKWTFMFCLQAHGASFNGKFMVWKE
jgi:hypothetical protein